MTNRLDKLKKLSSLLEDTESLGETPTVVISTKDKRDEKDKKPEVIIDNEFNIKDK